MGYVAPNRAVTESPVAFLSSDVAWVAGIT